MRILEVRVKNFRTLKDVSITFDSVTTFIGPNGTGRSTVLRALDWFFNGKPGELNDSDCSFGAIDEDIEVQVTFAGLPEKDRTELGKYAPPGSTSFTAWKRRGINGEEVLSANSKCYLSFNAVRDKTSATDKKTAYNGLRTADSSLALPAWSSVDVANQAMTAWELEHTNQLVDAPENLQTNFFGFNSGGKMSGLFDFVLVAADLRAGEESLDGKSSIIGRVLERSVDRTAADEEIAKIVEASKGAQQKVYDEKFNTQLVAITDQLNRVVASYSPGRAISVVPTDVELKLPRTTFQVSVVDGETETIVERQGHGFQRTLLISALQVLAESGAASAEGVICLAIEEPELFQHPIQAQAFAKVLRSLAEDVSKRIQVTYATHSPYFVEARHFDQIRRLTRSSDVRPVVKVHSTTVKDVKASLTDIVKADVIDRQLDTSVTSQLSVALFAAKAVIVEGTTDSAVLYGIGDRLGIGSLEAVGIAIVPAGSNSSIPLAHAILSALGIPSFALFDADSGFEDRARKKGKLQDKIDEERNTHTVSNRRLLKYFGLPEVDFPSAQITDKVAIFEDCLETFLAAEWPAWITACEEVEQSIGVTLGKNQLAYRTATFMAQGTVPSELNEISAKIAG